MARGSVYGTRGIGLVVVRHPIPAHILPSTVDCEQTTMRWISLVLLAFAGFASAQYYLTREYPLQPTWMRILTAYPSRSLRPWPARVSGLLSHPLPLSRLVPLLIYNHRAHASQPAPTNARSPAARARRPTACAGTRAPTSTHAFPRYARRVWRRLRRGSR